MSKTQEDPNTSSPQETERISTSETDSCQTGKSVGKSVACAKHIIQSSVPCLSDGSLNNQEEMKQRSKYKIRTWNSNKGNREDTSDTLCTDKVETTLISEFEKMRLEPNMSEDNLCKSDWQRAKDSLENLLSPKNEKSEKGPSGEINGSKSEHSSAGKDKVLSTSPHSEPRLGSSRNGAGPSLSIARVVTWDPWDKLGRKNKDTKRRKLEKSPQTIKDDIKLGPPNTSVQWRDHIAGDEVRNPVNEQQPMDYSQEEESYEYQPYCRPKNTKSVEFTNKVLVIYFTGDEVLGESMEPLKKELEQQERNKEMRKGHSPMLRDTIRS